MAVHYHSPSTQSHSTRILWPYWDQKSAQYPHHYWSHWAQKCWLCSCCPSKWCCKPQWVLPRPTSGSSTQLRAPRSSMRQGKSPPTLCEVSHCHMCMHNFNLFCFHFYLKRANVTNMQDWKISFLCLALKRAQKLMATSACGTVYWKSWLLKYVTSYAYALKELIMKKKPYYDMLYIRTNTFPFISAYGKTLTTCAVVGASSVHTCVFTATSIRRVTFIDICTRHKI